MKTPILKYQPIKKSGNTYMFNEEKLGVGRENAKTFLRANPKIMKLARKQIWDSVMARVDS